MEKCLTISLANFESEVLKSEIPVLLDFWAPWCVPCRIIGPVLEQLAEEYAGRVKIGKVNIDEDPDLASSHGVISIPTLLVYRNGEIVNQASGALPKHNIEALFKELI